MSQRQSIKLPKISLHKPSGNARVWIKPEGKETENHLWRP